MIESRTDVWEENASVYQAFWDLNAERLNGMGEGVIPFVAIRSYAPEIDTPVLELLRRLRRMDKAYLEYRKQQEEEKAKQDEWRQRRADRARIHRRR